MKDFKGKYLYIDMWATWCGPCKREMPYLKELEKKMRQAAAELNFEEAASLRDRMIEVKKMLLDME